MMSWVTEFAGEQKRKHKNHKNNQLYIVGDLHDVIGFIYARKIWVIQR